MATIWRGQAQGVLWALLLFQLIAQIFAQQSTFSSVVLECSCDNANTAMNILSNGTASVCPCACGKTTLVPTTFTTVFTIYDTITSSEPVPASKSVSSVGSQDISHGADTSVPFSVPQSSVYSESLVSSSSIISRPSTLTSVATKGPPATPAASSVLPVQTNAPIFASSTQETVVQVSTASSAPTLSSAVVVVPPGGTITVKPITATSAETDGTYKTTSVTWLSIDIPATTTIDGQPIQTRFPAWRCISLDLCNPSCLVPDEVCLAAPIPNPLGYPWPEKPEDPPSPEHGFTMPSSSLTDDTVTSLTDDTVISLTSDTVTSLTSDTVTSLTDDTDTALTSDKITSLADDTVRSKKSKKSTAQAHTTTKAGGDDGGGDDGGDDGSGGGGGDDGGDGDDDDHHEDSDLDGFRIDGFRINGFRIDINFDNLFSRLLRDIFGWGMTSGIGINPPGKAEPDKPHKSRATKSKSTSASKSSSTSSCTVTYTLAPHCTQPCVVSQISSLGTSSYTTSCASATCRTTQLCTSIETTTTTTYTTKKPQRTAGCKPKSCPACKHETPSGGLEARQSWHDEVILQDTITEPETWHEGEWEWWEKMRRLAKYYGPGYHDTSTLHMDSTSSWTEFDNYAHGAGAGPVWGCSMVVAFSPKGIYASHLWEIPSFAIPEEDKELFEYDKGFTEEHYFNQNIDDFLQHGSQKFSWQDQFPALMPLVAEEGPLHPKDFQFFRAIIFVPIHATGTMFYSTENRKMIDILTNKLKIENKYITIYGYRPREVLSDDYRYDNGRATPPPQLRLSNPWDGLFSWLYTPKGPSGQRELVIRYEKEVVHRDAWCGDGHVPQAQADRSDFELRPKPKDSNLTPRQDEETCGKFLYCGVGCPGSTCADFLKKPAPKPQANGLQVRQAPSTEPLEAERELSTANMVDPQDSAGGELWWYIRMQYIVQERGPGYGGKPGTDGQWSTSVMTLYNQDLDGSITNRPRFGGSGPVWGCTMVIVASPQGVWTSHIWEVPTHTRGEENPDPSVFEFLSEVFPRETEEYFKEGFLDFLSDGNMLGTFKPNHEEEIPGRNPGLEEHFRENGAFNTAEQEWVWVGIITRSYKNLHVPRIKYHWEIKRVFDKFVAWGVPEENILVSAYAPRRELTTAEGMQPGMGSLSWQYHPEHFVNNHKEKKLRVRFEKEILFEKSWCGSGRKVVLPDNELQLQHRQADDQACELAVSSAESASATSITTALPKPTQACASNNECGLLTCPDNRLNVCYHGFCQCAVMQNPNNTEIASGPVFATPTAVANISEILTSTVSLGTTSAAGWNASITSLITFTNTSSTTFMSTASTIFMSNSSITFMSISSATSMSIPSTTSMSTSLITTMITSSVTSMSTLSSISLPFNITLPPWEPEKPPGAACTTFQDCATLKCEDSKLPDCRIPEGGDKLGCHCIDKPKLLDPCTKSSECRAISCEATRRPNCRPLVNFIGATPICLCDSEPASAGDFCTVDGHCDGLSCDAGKRGLCRSGACQCDKALDQDVVCRVHADCAASITTCAADKNLRCDDGRCVCKECMDKFKILGCQGGEDCNHCCPRGELPKCLFGCSEFWCGKECQCGGW
ncbi:hypothetical protein EsH8_X_000435 [Colletotrichum jinshuiense]